MILLFHKNNTILFLNFFDYLYSKKIKKMSDEEKMKVLFEKYDTDKNGVLDRREFKIIFHHLLHEMGENIPEKKHEQVIDEAMANFDSNQNGIIEFNEFVDLMYFLINEKGYELK